MCGLHLAGWARLKMLLREEGVWRVRKERGGNLWGAHAKDTQSGNRGDLLIYVFL